MPIYHCTAVLSKVHLIIIAINTTRAPSKENTLGAGKSWQTQKQKQQQKQQQRKSNPHATPNKTRLSRVQCSPTARYVDDSRGARTQYVATSAFSCNRVALLRTAVLLACHTHINPLRTALLLHYCLLHYYCCTTTVALLSVALLQLSLIHI